MIKMIAAICRRPGMTQAECLAYAQHRHGALALENPVRLRRYVQNHVSDGAYGTLAQAQHLAGQVLARDSVTELFWDQPSDMLANFQHPHVQTRVGPDGANFCDTSLSLSLVAQAQEQPVPQPGSGSAKVMHMLFAPAGLQAADFHHLWAAAHAWALDAAPEAARLLRRTEHNRQMAEFNPMLSYFGGLAEHPDGVACHWFDTPQDRLAFRDYERALLAFNDLPGQAFMQPARGFFLHVQEVPILG